MNEIQVNNQPKGIQEDERSLLIDYYVQKVEGRLRQLRSPSENDKKRWIWELLQNAKDTISSLKDRNAINVEVELKDDFVTFKHNGAPFTPKALNSLKWQKSGEKRGNAESTGRFGTGFLTTHTLSSKVDVKSVLIDKEDKLWGFEITLYRDGERDEELRNGIEKTLQSEKYFSEPNNDWTAFTYNLKSGINKESAKAGVKNLESNIFFTLAFVDEIESIKLTTNEKILFVKKIENATIGELQVVRFIVEENEQKKNVSVFIKKANEYSEELTKKFNQSRNLRYSIAIQVLEDTKEVIPISSETPHLYCDFPLVGTENFHFPVVLNSRDFEPVAERDRLLLDGSIINEEKQEITNQGINKSILTKSLELYKKLLSYLSKNNWKNIHLLANGASKIPIQERDFDKEWYKEDIQKEIRLFVKETPIVETSSGLQKLDEIYFPQGSKKEISKIWNFTNDISPNKLPKFELIEEWSKLIWKDCNNQTVEELARQVSEYQILDSLKQEIEWLNQLLEFISEKDTDLLNTYPLIPNVKGEFKTLDYEGLSKNNGLPDTAFCLLNGFDVDWEDIIVKDGIDAIKLTLNKGIKELAAEINDIIKDIPNSENDLWKKGIFNLIATIPTENENITSEFREKRKLLWKYSRDIFGDNQIDKTDADNLNESIWERCDDFFILMLIEEVSSKKTLRGLTELNSTLNIDWLNEFIGFVKDKVNSDVFNKEDYKILPNQKGDFSIKTELSKDDNIDELLKSEVIISLGIDLKNQLLDNRITHFTPENTCKITEVATRINDLLKSKEVDNKIKDNAAFHLVSILPNEQNDFQFRLWEFSRDIYGKKVSETTSKITNYHPTLWSTSNDFLLKKIVANIEEFTPDINNENTKNSVEQFAEYLKEVSEVEKENWNDTAVLWLSKFVDFLSTNKLSIGKIVPNQNDNFEDLEQLNSDKQIPETLKDILSLLNEEKDFRNILIHQGISLQPTHSKNTEDIGSEIATQIELDYKQKREDDNFKKAVQLLVVDWFNKPKYPYDVSEKYQDKNVNYNLFKWVYTHRFELETNVLSSVEERKYLYQFNSTIREQNIPFEEAVIIHQSEYDDLKSENATLQAEVKKLREEQGVTEAKTLVNTYGLTEDRIKLLLRIEEIAKRKEGTSNFLEQSAQELINQTGIKGEEIVNSYLIDKFGTDRVLWVSRADKNLNHRQEPRYDFEVLTSDLTKVMWYIDAKATMTREQESDKIPILIRKGTWDFIRENTNEEIFLARVFGARQEKSNNVQLLKIKYEK